MPQLESVRLQRCCLDDARLRPLGRCTWLCCARAVFSPAQASRSQRRWDAPVQATKSYVPQEFREQLLRVGQARRAFFGAINDSARTRITKRELCSFTWSFRFKRNAGRVWGLGPRGAFECALYMHAMYDKGITCIVWVLHALYGYCMYARLF